VSPHGPPATRPPYARAAAPPPSQCPALHSPDRPLPVKHHASIVSLNASFIISPSEAGGGVGESIGGPGTGQFRRWNLGRTDDELLDTELPHGVLGGSDFGHLD